MLYLRCAFNENSSTYKNKSNTSTSTICPFTKIIEDIFKKPNKSSQNFLKDNENAKLFLNKIANVTIDDDNNNRPNQEALVNDIIASINRIKNNITTENNENETKLNEAIILSVPKESTKNLTSRKEDNITDEITNAEEVNNLKYGAQIDKLQINSESINSHDETSNNTTEKTTYIEILTIEPNNTHANNTTSHNIVEVLKHLMPLFNSSLTKELYNITVIDRNPNKNHTITASKNVSTIVVTYCDSGNASKSNTTIDLKEIELKIPGNDTDYQYYDDDNPDSEEDSDTNLTFGEKKDILEAAEYGVQKMHELYTVLEPKLYSMGKWYLLVITPKTLDCLVAITEYN